MNPPRATDRDSSGFLIGTPREASACEAARVQPPRPRSPAHDAFARLLARLEPDAEALWHEVRPHVRRTDRILVVGDTVLDTPYARKMGLVGPFWPGKQQRVLRGINLVTLAWTDGDAVVPCEDLTGQTLTGALLLASVVDPKTCDATQDKFIALGLQVAGGQITKGEK